MQEQISNFLWLNKILAGKERGIGNRESRRLLYRPPGLLEGALGSAPDPAGAVPAGGVGAPTQILWLFPSSLSHRLWLLSVERVPGLRVRNPLCHLKPSVCLGKGLPWVPDSHLLNASAKPLSPGEGHGYVLLYSCLGNPMAEEPGIRPWGHKESDTTTTLCLLCKFWRPLNKWDSRF